MEGAFQQRPEAVALLRHVVHLHLGHRRQGDGTTERIPNEGAAVVAGPQDAERVRLADRRRDGDQSAAERLAEGHQVGLGVLVLPGEAPAGPAESGLHLVPDQQHVVSGTDLPHAGEVALRRHDDAALCLDRFQQDRGRPRRDCRPERSQIAERHRAEPRNERPEDTLVAFLAAEPDHADPAPVEVPFGHDDLGFIGRHALDRVGPFARDFQARLHGLDARVHRARLVGAGVCAKGLEEEGEFRAVQGPTHERQLFQLLAGRADHELAPMAVGQGRIGADAIQVRVPGAVVDDRAGGTDDVDGQRPVVVRSVPLGQLDSLVIGQILDDRPHSAVRNLLPKRPIIRRVHDAPPGSFSQSCFQGCARPTTDRAHHTGRGSDGQRFERLVPTARLAAFPLAPMVGVASPLEVV